VSLDGDFDPSAMAANVEHFTLVSLRAQTEAFACKAAIQEMGEKILRRCDNLDVAAGETHRILAAMNVMIRNQETRLQEIALVVERCDKTLTRLLKKGGL
jgi:hypothetical protein